MNTPIFKKRQPHVYDYKPMTWETFLKLIKVSNDIYNQCGHPVYLVGSALYKEKPRDIDICIIIPHQKYEELYGTLILPDIKEPKEYNKCLSEYLNNVFIKNSKYYFMLWDILEDYNFDFKVYPDNWFTDKPKLLLSEQCFKQNIAVP